MGWQVNLILYYIELVLLFYLMNGAGQGLQLPGQ